MLTGDEAYLEPYERAIGEFRTSTDTAVNMLQGAMTPSCEAAITELQKWTGVKVVELTSTTELFGAGNVAGAMKLVRTDAGKAAMEQIRRNGALLIEEERALLSNARSETRRSRRLVRACVIALSFLSLFGFALALRNLRRSQKPGIAEEQARQVVERARAHRPAGPQTQSPGDEHILVAIAGSEPKGMETGGIELADPPSTWR